MNFASIFRDIPYGRSHERQVGDLFLPASPRVDASPVLLIHGGGWNALTKQSLEPVVHLAAEDGRSVFNINYRLLAHAPWPACRDDCVSAARFVLDGGLAAHGLRAPADGRVLVIGASAGGHLAMLTGLALGSRACAGIVSMAGPTRVDPRDDTSESAICAPNFHRLFFGHSRGPTPEELRDASPSSLVTPDSPPLRIIHSQNDLLVPPSHSEEAVRAWRAVGGQAALDYFDGPGDYHGFWDSDDLATRKLILEVENLMRQSLRHF